ncbi:hypothetical protein IJG91_02525 [Candidatus Saccharibacteria bacterium]|nr:hypothetical protein [Candidatus Saccharibacteria bacterium]
MDNKTVYKKTIGFSIRSLLWDLLATIIFVGCMVAGFFILEKTSSLGLLGLGVGAIVGGIFAYLILHFIGYAYKAGQIAMMTKAVSEGKLPEDTIGEGKKIVKERFGTVAAYFAITGVIKGIFRQIGNGITAIGNAVGGDAGGTIGGTISAVIETIVAYLCDCCLGWVFYRKDEKASKATLEGAVIFFKHGKTLAKNLGRVFGISIISFILIGGIFFGISWLIMQAFPNLFSSLSAAIAEISENVPAWASDTTTLTLVCAGLTGIVMWSIIHSTFVRPFILVGVLRNFIKSGIEDKPSEKSFDELDEKSKKFKELHAKIEAEI